jgi:hypothetical protein
MHSSVFRAHWFINVDFARPVGRLLAGWRPLKQENSGTPTSAKPGWACRRIYTTAEDASDPQHHLQRNRRTISFAGRLVIEGLNQGQKRLPSNRDLHLIQEALATRPLFSVDLLVVREAQLEGGCHPFQSQSWIWIDFSGFFRGSLKTMVSTTTATKKASASMLTISSFQDMSSPLQVLTIARCLLACWIPRTNKVVFGQIRHIQASASRNY